MLEYHNEFLCSISDPFVQRRRGFFSCESQEITYTSAEALEKHSERGTFNFHQGRLSLQIRNSVGAENAKIKQNKKAGFYVWLKSVSSY